jgi:hypothetical protein
MAHYNKQILAYQPNKWQSNSDKYTIVLRYMLQQCRLQLGVIPLLLICSR